METSIKDNTLISKFLIELVSGKRIFQAAYDQIFNPLYVKDLEKIVKIFLKKKIKGYLMLVVLKNYLD